VDGSTGSSDETSPTTREHLSTATPPAPPPFEKSALLYRPTHHHLTPTGSVVVVEGVLDALALAAAASAAGRSADFAPCTASGVTATPTQAGQVLGLAPGRPPVIAMDGDEAGR